MDLLNTFKIGWTEAIRVCLLLLEKNTIPFLSSFLTAFEKKEKKHVLKQKQVPIVIVSDVQLLCGFLNTCFTESNIVILILFLFWLQDSILYFILKNSETMKIWTLSISLPFTLTKLFIFYYFDGYSVSSNAKGHVYLFSHEMCKLLRLFCFSLLRWMDEQFCRTGLFTSCYHCWSWGGIS